MSSVADELVTKYTLRDDYSAGLARIGRNSQSAARQINAAKGSIDGGGSKGGLMGAFSSLKGGVNEVTMALTAVVAGITAVVGVGAGLIVFGMKAMESFAKYDTLERIFTGVYGSAKSAKQMMAFLNTEAQKGQFTFEGLATSASKLVMQGLKFTDYKDTLQAIAMRGGGGDEKLSEATEALMKLKAGENGRAFRTLMDMGIGKDELAKLGAVFDKSGEFVGNTQQALAVFNKIGLASAGIVKAMEGSPAAMLANIKEGMTRAMGAIGAGIFAEVKGGIGGLVDAINTAVDSGAIKDAFRSVVNIFTGDGGPINMTNVIASVLAGVQTAAMFVKQTWDFIKAVLDSPIIKALTQMFLHVGAGAGINAAWQDLAPQYDKFYGQAVATMDRYASKKHNDKEPDNPKAAQTPLQAIADNTKETAKNTKAQADMSRHVFGGGDLGRLGVTPLELRQRSRPEVNIKVAGGLGKAIENLVMAVATQAVTQVRRQGAH